MQSACKLPGRGLIIQRGYATTIHCTGEADLLIASFLYLETVELSPNLDTSACPDCKGAGFYYPKEVEGRVARCKHDQLRK